MIDLGFELRSVRKVIFVCALLTTSPFCNDLMQQRFIDRVDERKKRFEEKCNFFSLGVQPTS